MRATCVTFVTLLCWSMSPALAARQTASAQATRTQKTDPRLQVDTAILEMIRLLEKKDVATLIRTFATAEEIQRLTRDRTFEQRVEEFANEKAAGMLEALKAAAKMQPTLNPEGTRAEYRFGAPVGGESRVRLQKIEGFWYLR